MEIFHFIFRLGVVFAIYGFIWGIIDLIFLMLNGTRKRSVAEFYILKAIKYIFLVNVTLLVCLKGEFDDLNTLSQVVIAGIILVMYFVGKFQNNQNKQVLFRVMANGMNRSVGQFNFNAEISVILLALAAYIGLWFMPELATNAISIWFQESIFGIEKTPLIGFIFQVIGFFFLLNIIFKMVNGILYILTGQRPSNTNGPIDPFGNDSNQSNTVIEDEYVDFEEVDETDDK